MLPAKAADSLGQAAAAELGGGLGSAGWPVSCAETEAGSAGMQVGCHLVTNNTELLRESLAYKTNYVQENVYQ